MGRASLDCNNWCAPGLLLVVGGRGWDAHSGQVLPCQESEVAPQRPDCLGASSVPAQSPQRHVKS